ncbi:hypothetical protein ACHAWF_000461, partial [Thalassiosira exigua]
ALICSNRLAPGKIGHTYGGSWWSASHTRRTRTGRMGRGRNPIKRRSRTSSLPPRTRSRSSSSRT